MEQFSWSVNPVPLETRWTRLQEGTVILKNRLLKGTTASQQMMHGQTEKDKGDRNVRTVMMRTVYYLAKNSQ